MDQSGSDTQPSARRSSILRKKGAQQQRGSRADARLPLLNTYRLKPKYNFQLKPVLEILQEKTDPLFDKIMEYNFEDFAVLCKYLSIELLRAVNALYWPSYKIVVVVQCVEKADNSSRGAVRYYWNPQFDGIAVHRYRGDTYFISVSAAFFYYE